MLLVKLWYHGFDNVPAIYKDFLSQKITDYFESEIDAIVYPFSALAFVALWVGILP